MSGSQSTDRNPIKVENKSGYGPSEPEYHSLSDSAPVITGFMPDEFLPEDLPEVDPRYLNPNLVSATQLPQSQTGIPHMQWVPTEVYREPSNASVYEPDSVVGESGRLYHGYKEGKYFLPNDAAEQDRLDLQHQAVKVLLGDKLCLAPIKEPRHVLDLGTGTGIWAIDFAREHPQCHVIGTDLSKIQPEKVLPNVDFIREDGEDQWVFPHKFDYIHARMLFSCFDNPRGVMEQAFQFLNPGGWIEYIDAVRLSRRGTKALHQGLRSKDGESSWHKDWPAEEETPLVVSHYKEWLHEIGFIDILERKMPAAHGGWPKNPRLKLAGRFVERDTYDGARGISFGLLRAAGMGAAEIDEMVDQVRVDLLDPHIHSYVPMRCVYGRKPFEGETAESSKPHHQPVDRG
ncbi:S-adenosyl-L-methionine-dependent methyltransferase, partial [Apiospora sp. TS-2023a]